MNWILGDNVYLYYSRFMENVDPDEPFIWASRFRHHPGDIFVYKLLQR